MKKAIILAAIAIIAVVLYYLNHRFGLLSMAGLNGKGLPVKAVNGSLVSGAASSTKYIDHSEWSYLLAKYVSSKGDVDYKGFVRDKNKLEDYLNALSVQVPTDDWSVQDLLAYYINLYNAYTVNVIVKNYPVKSIKDIDGAWTKEIITIGNKALSLGALEHSILRKMNEPRIHFAINCASASCPKLVNEAYTPEKLDQQLEEATHGFINSDNNTIDQHDLQLSGIFKWYKNDFLGGELIKYINTYTTIKIAPKAKIEYKEYDWSLNEMD